MNGLMWIHQPTQGRWVSLNDEIFAYKGEDGIETLKEHVDECVNFIEEHYIKRNYHVMLSRRMCYSAEIIKDVLINAVRLHDIAKAYEPYQGRIKRGDSAFGHEIYSAVIFHKIFGIEYLPFTIAILYHHHTMSGTNHDEIFHRFYRIPDIIGSNKVSLEVNDKELAKIAGVNVEFPEIVTFKEAEKTLREFFECMKSHSTNPIYIFSALILHPILRGDNFAASKNRNKDEKRKQKYWIPVNVPRDVLCD